MLHEEAYVGAKKLDIHLRLSRRKKVMENGCWYWLGSHTKGGYPFIRYNGKTTNLARLAAHLYLGFDLNSDLNVNHKTSCNDKKCWYHEHLYIGTQGENIKDSVRIKTQWQSKKTHCLKGHLLDTITYRTRGKERYCSQCRRESNRRSYHKKQIDRKVV